MLRQGGNESGDNSQEILEYEEKGGGIDGVAAFQPIEKLVAVSAKHTETCGLSYNYQLPMCNTTPTFT